MSKERSPRDVCSTTMGINGLTAGPLGRAWSSGVAGRPELPGGSRLPCRRGSAPSRAWSGVHSRSRASACSIGIGVAPEVSTSTAFFIRRSWRSVSQPPWCRSSCSSRSGARPVASASARTCSSISSSETSMPSASATASTTSSRRTAFSASGRSSSTTCSSVRPLGGQVLLERDALGQLRRGLLEDRPDAPVDHDRGHVDRRLGDGGVDDHAPEELVDLAPGRPRPAAAARRRAARRGCRTR